MSAPKTATSTVLADARFRGTWNPVWMEDNEWLKKFDVDQYFNMHHETLDDEENEDDASPQDSDGGEHDDHQPRRRGGRRSVRFQLEDGGVAEPTSPASSSSSYDAHRMELDGDDEDGVRKLLHVFQFAAKAILLPAPWADPPLTKKQRKSLLGVLIHRYLDCCPNPIVLGKLIKDLLKDLQHEDVASDLFSHYVSYMSGAPWDKKSFIPQQAPKGSRATMLRQSYAPMLQYYDHYRSLHNFYNNEATLKEFREECDDGVEKRLRIIQQDVSRAEAKISLAIDQWHTLRDPQTPKPCFGNTITVELRELELEGSGQNLREEKWTAKEGNDDEVEVFVIDSKKVIERTRKLSRNVEITISTVFSSRIDVALPLRGANERPLQLDNGSRLLWPRTQPMAFFLGHKGRDIEEASISIQVRKRTLALLCGLVDGDLVADFSVPLKAPLYTNFAHYESIVREDLGDHAGVHVQRVTTSDVMRGVKATFDVYLSCLEPAHNTRPPPMDVPKEEERRRRMMQDVRDDVWRVDHHANFRALADTVGELDNEIYQILDLYADRYLIHDELRQTVLLVHAAVQSDFSKEDDRTLMEEALQGMMAMRGNITTRVCAKMMDKTMTLLRIQGVERLVTLESIVPSPEAAGPALDKIRSILNLTGLSAVDFPRMIASRTKQETEPNVKKLHKLARLLNSNSSASRMSVLHELNNSPDKQTLVAKARVLVDITEQSLAPLMEALKFALQTGHAGVHALAAMRIDAALVDMMQPFEQCVHHLVTSMLGSSLDPNPLSDECGMLMAFFGHTMDLVQTIGELPPACAKTLDEHCDRFVKLLDPFFPSLWFHLCKAKQPSWVTMLVEHEPLEPVSPGKIFHNETPADAQHLLDALLLVFIKAFRWSNPVLGATNIICFAKEIASFIEGLCEATIVKATSSSQMSEVMVGLCTYSRLCEQLEEYWTAVVEDTLIFVEFRPTEQSQQHKMAPKSVPPPAQAHHHAVLDTSMVPAKLLAPVMTASGDASGVAAGDVQRDMLHAQCVGIKTSTLAGLMECMEKFLDHIASRVRKNFVASLNLRMQNTNDGPGDAAFADVNLKELRRDLHFDLDDCIGVALPKPEGALQLTDDRATIRMSVMRASSMEGRHSFSNGRGRRSAARKMHGDLSLIADNLRESCVRAVYAALRDFGLTFATQVLTPGRKAQLLELIEVVEDVVRDIWPPIEGYIEEDLLITEAHACRSSVLWLCHTSPQLIHILSIGGQDGDVHSAADEMLLETIRQSGDHQLLNEILRHRTDKDARKFCS